MPYKSSKSYGRRNGVFRTAYKALPYVGALGKSLYKSFSGPKKKVGIKYKKAKPSYTGTLTQNSNYASGFHGIGTMTKMNYNYPIGNIKPNLKRVMREMPLNTFIYNSKFNLASTATGRQTGADVSIYGNADTDSIFALLSSSPEATESMFMQSATCEFTFSNADTAGVFVDIYDITLKRDIGTGTDETTNLTTPGSAINSGLIEQGQALGYSVLNSKPFDSQCFTTAFNVKKISRHYLAAGDTHRHRVTCNVNKVINKNRLTSSTQIKGLTHWVSFLAWGQPVNATTGGEVSSAPVSINAVYSVRYNFKWISDTSSLSSTSNNLNSALASPLFIDPINSTIAAPVDANPA